jgi:hypothetical protein
MPLLLAALTVITDIGLLVYQLRHSGISALEMLVAGLGLLALLAMLLRQPWHGLMIWALVLTSSQALLDFGVGSILWSLFRIVWPLFYIPQLVTESRRSRHRSD